MTLAELRFRHSRDAGDTSTLTVEITADAGHGAIGPNGISPALGFPRGLIDAQGWLKRGDGQTYQINPSSGGLGVQYRLTVKNAAKIISTITFPPIATNGVIDVNLLADTITPTPILPVQPSVQAGLPGTGFIVSNDATKTATLYWKFSDGTIKSLTFT